MLRVYMHALQMCAHAVIVCMFKEETTVCPLLAAKQTADCFIEASLPLAPPTYLKQLFRYKCPQAV